MDNNGKRSGQTALGVRGRAVFKRHRRRWGRSVALLSSLMLLASACAAGSEDQDAESTASPVTEEPQDQAGAGDGPELDGTPPASGQGFDEDEVRVGFALQSNAAAMAAAEGLEMDFGDTQRQIEALVADINAAGGVAGRTLVPVFHDADAGESSSVESQAACTRWTQDEPVIAVANGVAQLSTETLYSCLGEAGIPLVLASQAPLDDAAFSGYGDLLFGAGIASTDRLFPVLVDRLVERDFLTEESTIGVLYGEGTPWSPRGVERLEAELERHGLSIAERFGFAGGEDAAQQLTSAVLQFRSADVTHVLSVDGWVTGFMAVADQQGFEPAYGLHTYNGIGILPQAAPPSQLAGSMGVSFLPAGDLSPQHESTQTPGSQRCEDLMVEAGEVSEDPTALYLQRLYCEATWVAAIGIDNAPELTTEGLVAGIESIGPEFESAVTYAVDYGPNRHDGVAVARDIEFDEQCVCFRSGPQEHPLP